MMGGYGRPGRETGGGYCAIGFLCIMLIPLLVALTACEKQRIATALPIPPERIDCQDATGARPKLPPEYVIDWAKVANVGEAKAAHDNFVNVIHGREKIVATYVLEIEGRLFQCANDAAWLREREAEIPH